MYLKSAADHTPEKENSIVFSISQGKHSPACCSFHTSQASKILMTRAQLSGALCKLSSLLQLIFCTPKLRSLQLSGFRHRNFIRHIQKTRNLPQKPPTRRLSWEQSACTTHRQLCPIPASQGTTGLTRLEKYPVYQITEATEQS